MIIFLCGLFYIWFRTDSLDSSIEKRLLPGGMDQFELLNFTQLLTFVHDIRNAPVWHLERSAEPNKAAGPTWTEGSRSRPPLPLLKLQREYNLKKEEEKKAQKNIIVQNLLFSLPIGPAEILPEEFKSEMWSEVWI